MADNHISGIQSLSACINLTSLNLSFNKLNDLRTVATSLQGCRRLSVLQLNDNPIASQPMYRSTLVRACAALRELDTIPISVTDRKCAIETLQMSSLHQLMASGVISVSGLAVAAVSFMRRLRLHQSVNWYYYLPMGSHITACLRQTIRGRSCVARVYHLSKKRRAGTTQLSSACATCNASRWRKRLP